MAEAHTARGTASAFCTNGIGRRRSRSFKRALELNPGYVQGAAWYHLFYEGFACGRWDEALRGLREVQERDQLSGYAAGVIGIGYAAAAGSMTPSAIKAPLGSDAGPVAVRETFGASTLEWAEKALALDPDAFLAVWSRQLGYQTMTDGPGHSRPRVCPWQCPADRCCPW